MKKHSTTAPIPLTTEQIQAGKNRLRFSEIKSLIAAVCMVVFFVFVMYGGEHSEATINKLIGGGFFVVFINLYFYVRMCTGAGSYSEKPLSGQQYAWLKYGSEQVPEIAAFLAEVSAQKRGLLPHEFESLEKTYGAKVAESRPPQFA